jgi:hypothetical protein
MSSEITKQKSITTELRPLILPIVDYLAASDDRTSALAKILSGLIEEAVAVDREASRHLEKGRR